MFRLVRRIVPLALALAVATGCSNNNSSTPTTPTTPPNTISETFGPGPVTPNGTNTWQFAVSNPGTVTVQLLTISPDSSVLLGISLGVWNGTSCPAMASIADDQATQGTVLTGTLSVAGNLCVRVFDVGGLTQTENVTIVVNHP
jgi:hypothetical protein